MCREALSLVIPFLFFAVQFLASASDISISGLNFFEELKFPCFITFHRYPHGTQIHTTKPDFSSLPVSVDASLFPKLPTAEAMQDVVADQPLPTHARGYFAIIVSRTTFLLFCE